MSNKNVFSSSEKDNGYIEGNQNKIELLNCSLESQNCKEHLLIINKSYTNARNFHLEKDYLNSIESLKSAFYKASELKESPCSKCSLFFRFTIMQSLENINKELRDLTSGIFRKKRYQLIYKESCNILNDFKQKD
jgi:hypothetical protein